MTSENKATDRQYIDRLVNVNMLMIIYVQLWQTSAGDHMLEVLKDIFLTYSGYGEMNDDNLMSFASLTDMTD